MFLIILSLNCFYTRFIPYKLISFKFRFILLLFHPLSFFFFFFTSRQTMQQSHTCIYKTQGTEKRNFLHASPRATKVSPLLYCCNMDISHECESSSFEKLPFRSCSSTSIHRKTMRQSTLFDRRIDSRMNVNMHSWLNIAILLKHN